MDNTVEWLNLPPELWLVIISKILKSTFDLIRFRSVCTLWRSIINPPPSPSHTLHIPYHKFWLLIPTKIYRLEPLISNPSNKGWIIKIEESKLGKFRHIDILTNTHILHSKSRVLDFTNLRITELFESYTLNFSNDGGNLIPFESINDVCKVLLFPIEGQGHVVFALYKDRTLRVFNFGNNNLVILNNGNGINVFEDIILHKRKVYVVDRGGNIFWINSSSFELVQVLPYSFYLGTKKQLVVSHGILYMVDMYIDRPQNVIFDIKVFKLDEESKNWLYVSDLGDIVFVLLVKDYNISLSAEDYYGFQRNCIYFKIKHKIARFSLKDSTFKVAL